MSRYLPTLAAMTNGILVGATIVVTRFVIGQSTPAALALLRYTIGFACLVLPVLLAPRVRFARRDLLPIALLGITQFGILITLLNYALQYIPSARAALLFATFPLMTMVIAALLGHEQITPPKAVGVLLTIVGVGIALGDKAIVAVGADQSWIGELAVLASALSGALCSVLYRPYLRKYSALPMSAFAMLASVGFLACIAAGEGFFQSLPSFTPAGWLSVLFIGVSSGVGYYLWLWALSRTAATNVTVFLALNPITATVLGVLVLGEPVTPRFLLGLCCVALGLWIAHWRYNRPRLPARA
ncbi:MAG: DMT family transporter [Caldilineaceae bacterium]